MERTERVPHSHSLGGYGLISKAKETQPTTFPLFNVAGKCEKKLDTTLAPVSAYHAIGAIADTRAYASLQGAFPL
jgi:hypothetical protein